MAKRQARKAAKDFTVQVGDEVLIGMPRYTLPGDWSCATILWTDGVEILTEHTPPSCAPSGEKHRQVLPVGYVRAVRAGGDLHFFKEHARKAVEDAAAHVREVESELGRAREAVWERLDKINASGPVRVTETGIEDFSASADPEMEAAE